MIQKSFEYKESLLTGASEVAESRLTKQGTKTKLDEADQGLNKCLEMF